LLQSLLSQLPLARLALQSAPEITSACTAELASMAIEASRLVAASKRTSGNDADVESAAAHLCVRAESLIATRPVEQTQRTLQASLFVLEAFVFSLRAVATCVLATVATAETA
jgi:hypothetical protein